MNRAENKKGGDEITYLKTAWKGPVFAISTLVLIVAGALIIFFVVLPNQLASQIDAAIAKARAHFEAGDYVLAESQIAIIHSSQAKHIRDQQDEEMQALLDQIEDIRASWRGSVTFNVAPPQTKAYSAKDKREIQSGEILTLGSHSIRLEAPGYASITREVDLPKDGAAVDLGDVSLAREVGTIKVSSNKVDATVEITQKKSAGSVVAEFKKSTVRPGEQLEKVPTGVYVASWSRGDVILYQDEIQVAANESVDIIRELVDQQLNFYSNPDKAKVVWVNGSEEFIGVASFSKMIPSGRHIFRATIREDWEAKEQVVEVGTERPPSIEFNWPHATAHFKIKPHGAEVYLGDELLGTTPFTTILKPGDYKFRASLLGLQDLAITGEFDAGDSMIVEDQFRYGEIAINGPAGAEVHFGGKKQATLPLDNNIAVRPGILELTIKAPGIGEKNIAVNVPIWKTVTISASEAYR